MRKKLVFMLTLCSALSAYSQNEVQSESNENKVTELNEIVVKGDNVWVEGDKIVFRPQKNAKNLSTDAMSLIRNMNTGLLFVEDGNIKSRNGQSVAIFINGVKADGMDLSTFWPKNALRVEYIESSDDPRFAGYTNVVNFVMKEYVTGGLTKLEGDQTFPNQGSYSAASKLVYKKMTYNALFKGGYSRNHQLGEDRLERYEDIWYGGEHYDVVEREQRSDQANRSNNLYGGFNARYRTNKLNITHSAALEWNQDPRSGSHGFVNYTPYIISGNSMTEQMRSHSLSPSLTGSYIIMPGGKWSYNIGWNFSHSHNNSLSEFEELSINPITNRVKEDLYKYFVGATIWYAISRNNVFDFTVKESRLLSSAAYSGTTNSHQWQHSGETLVKLRWQYKPADKIFITLSPQVTMNDWDVEHKVKKSNWLPGISGSINWTINKRNGLNVTAYYNQRTPSASMRNDLIMRQTELKWLEGNPMIESERAEAFNLGWFTTPFNWLTSNIHLGYDISTYGNFLAYRSGGPNYDGVIGQYMNPGNEKSFSFFWSVGASLFNGSISISNQLQYNYSRWSYPGSPRIGRWYERPSVTWYFGNCSLRLSYNSPQKWISEGGSEKTTYPYQCGLNFSYGVGNLNIDVSADNIFQKRMNYERWYASGPYSFHENHWNTGRNFNISLTYTFDYGKKVEPGIDISEQNIRSSSVLGSEK